MTARGSLAFRLAALAAIGSALFLFVGVVALGSLYRNAVYFDLDQELIAALSLLESDVRVDETGVVRFEDAPEPDFEVDPPFWSGVAGDARMELTNFSGRYWIVGRLDPNEADGYVTRARSVSLLGALQLDPDTLRRAIEAGGRQITGYGLARWPDPERMRLRASVLGLDDGADYVLAVAASDSLIRDRIAGYRLRGLLLLTPFALLLIGAVFLQVRVGLVPLYRMRDAVAQIREGERERLDDEAPVELLPLADELNALIDHNRDVVERARAHVGNLAHALKTPIAVLMNESRSVEGALAEVVSRQSAAMSAQVDHHLKRASAAARAQSVGARTPVKSVIDDLARTLPRMHADKAIALEVSRPEELYFRGERQDLEEMVGNLMDNAFKWATAAVSVRVTAGPEPGRMQVLVEDDGPGLPPDKRAEVVRRGARLDEAAPGSGLGLSIVVDLARAYAGALRLDDSRLGGLAAAIDLPAAGARRTTQR